MRNLLNFLPSEFLPLVIAVVALGIITRLIGVKTGFGIITSFVASILLAPFLGAVFENLPSWLCLLVVAFTGLALLQGFAALFIGDRASDAMAGSLAANLVLPLVRVCLFPLRLIVTGTGAIARRWMLRGY